MQIHSIPKGMDTLCIFFDGKLIRINPRDFDIEKSYGYSIPFGGLKGIKRIIKPKKH